MPSTPTPDDAALRTHVLETISECLAASGLAMPTVPDGVGLIDRIAGFDSLVAVEATVALEERLKIELAGDCIFIEERPGRAPHARTLDEVVAALRDASAGALR